MSYKFSLGYGNDRPGLKTFLISGSGIPSTFVNIIFDMLNPLSYPGTGNTITDLSVNAYEGTIQGPTIDTDGTLLFNSPSTDGYGVYLNGPEFISGPDDAVDNLTIITWIKCISGTSGQTNDSRVVFSFDRSEVFRMSIGNDSLPEAAGKPSFAFTNTDGIFDVTSTNYLGDLRDDEWHQVSIVFRANQVDGLKFYIDNQLIHTENSAYLPIGNQVTLASPRYGWIGNGSESNVPGGTIGPVQPFYGNIGYVQFLDIANEGRIAQNYNQYKPIYDPLTITLDNVVNPTYYTAADGSINVTVSGSISPYTYSWSSGETVEDISGLADGTYILTVTDAVGTQKTLEVTLTQPAYVPMVITLDSANDPSGSGASDGSINVTVTNGVAPYNYSWSNGATTDDITSLADGTYTLTVTDDIGTQETLEVTIAYTGPTIYNLTWDSPVGTSNVSYFPAYGLYDYSVSMCLIYPEELTALATVPEAITGLEIEVNNYSSGYTYNNFEIWMGHFGRNQFNSTDRADLTTSPVTDLIRVKNSFNWNLGGNGWKPVTFDTNFEWNGTDNIIIYYKNYSGQWNSGYGWGESHTVPDRTTLNVSGAVYIDNTFPTAQALTRSTRRLNTKLKY